MGRFQNLERDFHTSFDIKGDAELKQTLDKLSKGQADSVFRKAIDQFRQIRTSNSVKYKAIRMDGLQDRHDRAWICP